MKPTKLKKVIGSALMLSLSMVVLACTSSNIAGASDGAINERHFRYENGMPARDALIITDNETGVQYILIDGEKAYAITPRLDASGKVMVKK